MINAPRLLALGPVFVTGTAALALIVLLAWAVDRQIPPARLALVFAGCVLTLIVALVALVEIR